MEKVSLEDVRKEAPVLAEVLQKFIDLDKKKEEVKKFYEEYDATVLEIEDACGLYFSFQDDDGTVYQVDKCEWKSVKMTPIEIKRTRREGERNGSLSMKKARELGYTVEGE